MEVNGFQNRRRHLCNAALREIKDAEERGQLGCGERLLPVGRKELGHTDTFTRGGLTLPGSAVSQLRVAMDGHTVMQSWALGRERGEVPGLRRDSSQDCSKPRLHLTKAPHTLPVGNIPIRQCFRSIYKQPGMGIEGRGGG